MEHHKGNPGFSSITIWAVGDIAFEGKGSDRPRKELFDFFPNIRKGSMVAVGNLEGPLINKKCPVAGKCTLRGSPLWAQILSYVGFGVMSLANNHTMDQGEEGLLATMRAIDEAGIIGVGAGRDAEEACAASVITLSGLRVAFLGRSSVIVKSPSYAGNISAGVSFFDLEETVDQIKASKEVADIVVVLLHWGIEEYRYPSTKQREIATNLVEAGADLILGHHPHVLQGVVRIGRGLVCYSLGNFFFDEFKWSFIDKDGERQERLIRLTEENRKGAILKIRLSKSGVDSYEFIPTRIGEDGVVRLDVTTERDKEFKRLCSRLHWPGYAVFWRIYSLWMEWKLRLKPMTLGRLKWVNLKKLRPKHIKELFDGIKRSGRITAEKSTNPYE